MQRCCKPELRNPVAVRRKGDRLARGDLHAGAPGLTRFGNEMLFVVDLP
jgi:hypothetical protein